MNSHHVWIPVDMSKLIGNPRWESGRKHKFFTGKFADLGSLF